MRRWSSNSHKVMSNLVYAPNMTIHPPSVGVVIGEFELNKRNPGGIPLTLLLSTTVGEPLTGPHRLTWPNDGPAGLTFLALTFTIGIIAEGNNMYAATSGRS